MTPSNFSELNPVFTGTELTMLCPVCRDRFPIRVNYQSNPTPPATWGLTHPEGVFDWDKVTLTPSINNHPQARSKIKCNAHFSISEGKVLMS